MLLKPFGVNWRSVVQENSDILVSARDVASRTGLRPPPWALKRLVRLLFMVSRESGIS